ncbi:Pectinesterase inhibitor [Quillaja saponaria]|uniref:Pectinesterase inhibitor n=1 Tax=Quillaja saponaria TaxID=32244 RepID=A0AAD7L6Z4_QUISA|nr:Pectinesterase inhibitor [Quillaja saponaria]
MQHMHETMLQFSFFSFTLCFFFLIIISHGRSSISTISATPNDLINQTCKTCSGRSTVLKYNFCSASLEAIPVSHATNLQGLALVAMELALENATHTVISIMNLLKNGTSFDHFELASLKDCLELYWDAVLSIADSIEAFLSENNEIAEMGMFGSMEAAATCEEGFLEKKVEVHPLTKENYNLLQLCDIALCIIRLLVNGLIM